ncbi:flagellar protein FlgN [Dethiothermospora halolimnae]|uniref:flagellar protein FlgN n=1 Tax=Dethiothermospora halolimnae TaxID=3114390 RepID=UPI003CCBABBD
MDKKEEVKALTFLVREKGKLLNEIVDFTNRQTKFIESEDMNKLQNVIEKKQRVIDRVDRIDKGFSKQFDGIKKKYNIKEISEIDVDRDVLLELKEETKKVYELLNDIKKIEAKNKDIMKENLDKVKAKVKSVRHGKKITSGYYKKSEQNYGYFIDKNK